MSEERFIYGSDKYWVKDIENNVDLFPIDVLILLNEQEATISRLEEEKEYWKRKAMTLLMQVRRLTPRMTDKEVIEFSKELDDE